MIVLSSYIHVVSSYNHVASLYDSGSEWASLGHAYGCPLFWKMPANRGIFHAIFLVKDNEIKHCPSCELINWKITCRFIGHFKMCSKCPIIGFSYNYKLLGLRFC